MHQSVSQSTSALSAFFVAIALYPEVQKRAQAELDSVVGPHRLPEYGDSPDLVYVNALIKELLRWHLVLPLGVPHFTLEDDEFNGYFIPAGTALMTNVWCVPRTSSFSSCPGCAHHRTQGHHARPRSVRPPRRVPTRTLHTRWQARPDRARPQCVHIRIWQEASVCGSTTMAIAQLLMHITPLSGSALGDTSHTRRCSSTSRASCMSLTLVPHSTRRVGRSRSNTGKATVWPRTYFAGGVAIHVISQ